MKSLPSWSNTISSRNRISIGCSNDSISYNCYSFNSKSGSNISNSRSNKSNNKSNKIKVIIWSVKVITVIVIYIMVSCQ